MKKKHKKHKQTQNFLVECSYYRFVERAIIYITKRNTQTSFSGVYMSSLVIFLPHPSSLLV
jgi:hypothetical protein